MDVLSTPLPPVHVIDDTSLSPADPFWQSTPRSPPAGLAAVMAAVQQVVAPGPSAGSGQRPAKPPPQANISRRPQCTHMIMTRLYGHHPCFMCGKVPSIGWLYACRQDHELDFNAYVPDLEGECQVPNDSGWFDIQTRVAESLGMSSSVVNGIRALEYNFGQVNKLIEQKMHLLAAIRQAANAPLGSSLPDSQTRARSAHTPLNIIASVGTGASTGVQPATRSELPMTPAGTPVNIPAHSVAGTPLKKTSRIKKPTCNFQVCHTCRPFFQDRLYTSFESVLNGELPALTELDMARLPMGNPAVVRQLGLRQPSQPACFPRIQSRESLDITMQQHDGSEEDTSELTPTSLTNTESDSDQFNNIDRYPCPGAGSCPLWSRESGCVYESGFDDDLRALNHGFGPEPDWSRRTPENSLSRLRRVRGRITGTPGRTSSTASSISLPTPTTVPLVTMTPAAESFDDALSMQFSTPRKAATVCGFPSSKSPRGSGFGLGITGKESTSSLGSEVEVEGGVALTEEAVETGVPDILTTD